MKTNLLFAVAAGLVGPVAAQTATEPPEAVVMRQIDAWNRHDAAAFAATYADSLKLYAFPNTLRRAFTSRQEVQDFYADFFRKNPALHADVPGRLVLGNTVVLRETVTGRADGRVVQSVVTYKIREGKITAVYFDYDRP
jgi:hypothetical protein